MQLQHLRPGDIVDVVAPASACAKAELQQGVRAIRDLGLVPRIAKNIFARSLLFSNSDEERLEQLHRAIYAPDSKMIWCVRGGYGALRLMPAIEKWKRPRLRKIFLGYSDITTLHVHLNQKWHWPTLHGPMLERFGRQGLKPLERRELLGLIFGQQANVEFSKLKSLNAPARQVRSIHAPLVGGNMAVLQSGLGTPSALRPKGRIIFFEDIGERPHRVDRMLMQMEQAGWFRSCRAVLFGDFLLSEARDRRGLWQDVIPRFSARMKVPVVAGLEVGHGNGHQRTLPFNTPATLRLGRSPRLTVTSGIDSL